MPGGRGRRQVRLRDGDLLRQLVDLAGQHRDAAARVLDRRAELVDVARGARDGVLLVVALLVAPRSVLTHPVGKNTSRTLRRRLRGGLSCQVLRSSGAVLGACSGR